jgi:sugar phosphate isomerase/epimerase
VRVRVENNVLAPFNLVDGVNQSLLGVTAEDLLEILELTGSPQLGLLLDLGHLKVSARALGFSPEKALAAAAHRTEILHLSDNDGTEDKNLPFGPDAWFMPLLASVPARALVAEVDAVHSGDLPAIAALLKNSGATKKG